MPKQDGGGEGLEQAGARPGRLTAEEMTQVFGSHGCFQTKKGQKFEPPFGYRRAYYIMWNSREQVVFFFLFFFGFFRGFPPP